MMNGKKITARVYNKPHLDQKMKRLQEKWEKLKQKEIQLIQYYDPVNRYSKCHHYIQDLRQDYKDDIQNLGKYILSGFDGVAVIKQLFKQKVQSSGKSVLIKQQDFQFGEKDIKINNKLKELGRLQSAKIESLNKRQSINKVRPQTGENTFKKVQSVEYTETNRKQQRYWKLNRKYETPKKIVKTNTYSPIVELKSQNQERLFKKIQEQKLRPGNNHQRSGKDITISSANMKSLIEQYKQLIKNQQNQKKKYSKPILKSYKSKANFSCTALKQFYSLNKDQQSYCQLTQIIQSEINPFIQEGKEALLCLRQISEFFSINAKSKVYSQNQDFQFSYQWKNLPKSYQFQPRIRPYLSHHKHTHINDFKNLEYLNLVKLNVL